MTHIGSLSPICTFTLLADVLSLFNIRWLVLTLNFIFISPLFAHYSIRITSQLPYAPAPFYQLLLSQFNIFHRLAHFFLKLHLCLHLPQHIFFFVCGIGHMFFHKSFLIRHSFMKSYCKPADLHNQIFELCSSYKCSLMFHCIFGLSRFSPLIICYH